MNMKRIFGILYLILSITIIGRVPLCAQTAPILFHSETYMMDSGTHDGLMSTSHIAFKDVVHVPGVPWMQLHFSDYYLGELSYITLTSVKDGSHQRLNGKTLASCHNLSVCYNGDSVAVELHVGPGDTDVFFRLGQITVGEWVNGDVEPADVCGSDDRVASTDPRVARIWPGGGTAFMVSNGAFLTAGHCITADFVYLHFNVPPSGCFGTPFRPLAEDRYEIDSSSIVSFNSGYNDWAVFSCSSDYGSIAQSQGGFYRMSKDSNPTTVRVTGYGEDDDPPGCGVPITNLNTDNWTLQTNSGPFVGEIHLGPSEVYLKYTVDTMGGNSGSPVIIDNSTVAVGIHTDGGCSGYGYNIGTSFENDSLENAIQAFSGVNVVYVDNGHPTALKEGTVFRPYGTVTQGVTSVPSGGIISIVTGSYSDKITINKTVTLVAPVGTVTIGI